VADIGNGSKHGQHWMSGISIATAFAAVFSAGVVWKSDAEQTKQLDRLDIRISNLERDHAGALPALRKLESEFVEMQRELQRLRWRLERDSPPGPGR